MSKHRCPSIGVQAATGDGVQKAAHRLSCLEELGSIGVQAATDHGVQKEAHRLSCLEDNKNPLVQALFGEI